MCHKIFDLQFFHDSNPSGPLINRLKYFRILFRFRQDFRSQSCLRGVQHTKEIISAVCYIPRKSSQRCATYRGRGDYLRDVQHTAEVNCTPRNQNRNLHLSMVAFKETIRRNHFRSEHIYHERKDLKKNILICTQRRQVCVRISRRNRIRTSLACLTGAQMGLNHEKS